MLPRFYSLSLLFLTLALLLPNPALAHKVKIFAAAEDGNITGFAYYPGGGKYMNSPIQVFAPRENKVAELTTDDKGAFIYTPQQNSEHLFVIQTKDGHRAEFLVAAGTRHEEPEATAETQEQNPKKTRHATDPASKEELKRLIRAAVSKELLPLREDIARYEQKVRLHDVLGGIGYIAGLCGLALFLQGRKKRN